MEVGALKRAGSVTLVAEGGVRAARAIAQEKVPPHCNGVWLEQFRWEPGYQPPADTATLYDLFFDDDESSRIARGHVSPDASRLTDIPGREPVGVCFNVTQPDPRWFTEVKA
ncbi:MAG TPA: hypothetical protein VHL09_06445 [Dehalococcoidia bacterium]|nr:hypothetical protein [Dehalococcoidia bacterium]